MRAHLFLPDPARLGVMRKKLMVCDNCEPNRQSDVEESFAHPLGGAVGLCWSYQQPLYCSIRSLQQARARNREEPILGLRYADVKKVPRNLNFCFAFPIYDPRGTSFTAREAKPIIPQGCEDWIRIFDDGMEGTLLGVVTIDGKSDIFGPLSPEEAVHLVVRGTLIDAVQRRMLEVASECSAVLSQLTE